jgi:O-antigen/teichoic acid export membrane protein
MNGIGPTPDEQTATGATMVQSLEDEAETTAASNTTVGRVTRSGAWALVGQVLPQMYTIVTSVVAARYLGVSGLGHLSYIAFVQVTVVVIVTLALPQTLMRHVAELLGGGRRDSIRPFLRWGLKIQVPAAAAGTAVLVGAAALGASPQSAWVLAGVAAAAASLHTVPSALLIGAQEWKKATMVGLFTGAMTMGAKVAALSAGYRLPVLFGIDAIFSWVNLIGTSYLALAVLRRAAPTGLPLPSRTDMRKVERHAIRFLAVASIEVFVSLVVWRRSELFFLAHYSTNKQIAYYAIPFSFVSALLFVPEAAGRALLPAFATLFGARDTSRIKSAYGRSIRILLVLAVPVTAASMVLGPTFIELLYGSGFDNSAPVLLILLVALPAVQLLSVSNALLIGLGRPWAVSIVGVLAAIVNLTLDFVLIPRYAAIGAAIANTSAQVVGSLPVAFYASRLIGGVDWRPSSFVGVTVASLAGAAGAVAVVLGLPPAPALVVGALAFITLFGVVAHWVKLLPAQDANWLDATLGERYSGRAARLIRHIVLST